MTLFRVRSFHKYDPFHGMSLSFQYSDKYNFFYKRFIAESHLLIGYCNSLRPLNIDTVHVFGED